MYALRVFLCNNFSERRYDRVVRHTVFVLGSFEWSFMYFEGGDICCAGVVVPLRHPTIDVDRDASVDLKDLDEVDLRCPDAR